MEIKEFPLLLYLGLCGNTVLLFLFLSPALESPLLRCLLVCLAKGRARLPEILDIDCEASVKLLCVIPVTGTKYHSCAL